MALLCPPKRLTVNFPSDHEYTLQTLVEELFLVERHIRDNSWRLCDCTPSKHLPGIAGLASEGYGFAEDKHEREFMECLMSQARLFKSEIENRKIKTQEQWDQIRDWARKARHFISAKDWTGKESIEEQIDYSQNSLTEMVESLNQLKLDNLPEMEEKNTWDMVKFLCKKHSVPPPKNISFTEACNPFSPNAAHIQKDEHGENGLTPRPDLDELVFCKGATSAFAVAHEVKHYIEHYQGKMVADEAEATEFALSETRNNLYTEKGIVVEHKNNLYTDSIVDKGYIHSTLNNYRPNMAIDKKKGTTVLIGLATAKVVDKYVSPQLDTPLGQFASIGKVAIGAGAMWLGLSGKIKGLAGDLVTFAGAEFILTELFKYLPGGTVIASAPAFSAFSASAPIAVPMAPGNAVITAASQYSRMYQLPTRLTAGYPGVAQVDGKWVDQRV